MAVCKLQKPKDSSSFQATRSVRKEWQGVLSQIIPGLEFLGCLLVWISLKGWRSRSLIPVSNVSAIKSMLKKKQDCEHVSILSFCILLYLGSRKLSMLSIFRQGLLPQFVDILVSGNSLTDTTRNVSYWFPNISQFSWVDNQHKSVYPCHKESQYLSQWSPSKKSEDWSPASCHALCVSWGWKILQLILCCTLH